MLKLIIFYCLHIFSSVFEVIFPPAFYSFHCLLLPETLQALKEQVPPPALYCTAKSAPMAHNVKYIIELIDFFLPVCL